MKNKINELNNLYITLLEEIEKIRLCLGGHRIEHAFGFYNNHHITIENKIECIYYPIPTIICKLGGIKTKIGLDLVTDENYIGFIKFTLSREEILSFNFEALRSFRIGIYGYYYYQELVNFDDLEQVKHSALNSNESKLYIKIRISSISQIINIIKAMTKNKEASTQKRFSMSSYTCDCGQEITIETYYGQCPICGKDSPNKRKFKTKCPVCNYKTFVDQFGNGECENCGWLIDKTSTKNLDEVIYPNLISLNKAKRLYQEGKPFRPDLNDFLDGLYMYSEMEFWYKGLGCCLFLTNNPQGKIEFGWDKENEYYFSDKEDFIQNAKIGDEFVRDIWDKVENPKYM